jgi:toxin-antitoxin system PIN domain toxin
MNSFVVDANVWLAFLVQEHPHHAASRRWFNTLAPGQAGLCRVVQLTLLRLLGNRTIMASGAISDTEAWNHIGKLMEDERVDFLTEPPGLDSVLPNLFRYPVPTPNLVMDAYLAAFAISANRELVTRDRGFEQFRGLRVRFLEP